MRVSLVSILMFGILLCSCIREPESLENTKYGNFDALCSIIETRYCYLDEKGLNWEGLKKEYRQLLESKRTKYEIFDLFADFLAELKDGHVNLLSDFDMSRYDRFYIDSAPNFYPYLLFDTDSKYIRRKPRIAGGLRYEKMDAYNIAYIYYGSFSKNFSRANLRSVFSYFADCDALIIDVRNNGGGSVSNSEKLSSCFFDEKQLTAYMRHKTGAGRNDFSPAFPMYTSPMKDSALAWKKPVAVLTNRRSYSATNDFVCRMKCAPRAIVVGGWSGGGGGLPFSSELPCGWMLRFSASPMFDKDMNSIEAGIAPTHWAEINVVDPGLKEDVIIDKAIFELLKMK